MLLAEEVITNGTGIALGVVITIAIAAFAGGRLWNSLQNRLNALEAAQKADNEWRQNIFTPWRGKVNSTQGIIKDRLGIRDGGPPTRDPNAAQSRTSWPTTDDH